MTTTTIVPNYITPYQLGDTIIIESGNGSYPGFFNSGATLARCLIPLSKPVAPGLAAAISGSIRIRSISYNSSTNRPVGNITDFDIEKRNPIIGHINDTGIALDITNNNVSMGIGNAACSLGSMGITIEFVVDPEIVQ